MKSFGIWYRMDENGTPVTADLHINLWNIEKKKIKEIEPFIDFGMAVWDFRRIKSIKFLLPFEFEDREFEDLFGEVEVIGKVVSDREKLWQESNAYSGVEKEFFDQYFKEGETACAYALGKVTKYKNPLELSDLGIGFPPQSYLYLNSENERLTEAAAYGEI